LVPLSEDSDECVEKEEVIFIDPDRPPISSSDRRKIKNQIKSKAKK
jgi:hypothetical protein